MKGFAERANRGEDGDPMLIMELHRRRVGEGTVDKPLDSKTHSKVVDA
jgi:hypothetical protein